MTEIERLREALKPFADMADAMLAEAPADANVIRAWRGAYGNVVILTMDQLRAARAALTTPAEPSDAVMAERPESSDTPQSTWEACRIGSCHRHQQCMYHPCRSSAALRAREG